ncbi:unnamed protein product [Clavelina lepadiformis]|uniref:Tryptophan synthase beta chain-like PALP domain-containing protein n=1 Tax=Clavelina lepadiformis TaxID=159417 RepID=A0ABP0G407_CLALP
MRQDLNLGFAKMQENMKDMYSKLLAEKLKTGSFKIRGAANAIASLVRKNIKPDCIVTHSSGNFGLAVAKTANNFHIPAYIVMPSNAPECKKNAVKSYGSFVVQCASTEKALEQGAEKDCREKGDVLSTQIRQPK